ncbi:hypothetical protein GOP80_01615 [Planococcaceae bacterium Storch 2/2-2]|nr:hypothetical protein [Planococcaceae bacterium Storch 2/2-2]
MKKQMTAVALATSLVAAPMGNYASADELAGLTLEKEMREMIQQNIIKGTADGKYLPKKEVTRQEFAAFLARTLQLTPTTTSQFKDVGQNMAMRGEIGAVAKAGFMSGSRGGLFHPYDPMTREEMAVTISNVLQKYNVELSAERRVTVTDSSEFVIGSKGVQSAMLAFQSGIMSGVEVNDQRTAMTFAPSKLSQRDQAAAALYKLKQYVDGKTITDSGDGGLEVTPPTPPVEQPEPPTVEPEQPKEPEKPAKPTPEPPKVNIQRGYAAGPAGIITEIYAEPSLRTQVTYMEPGREMIILGQGNGYYKVQVADTIGYAAAKKVRKATNSNSDYYTVNSRNELVHYTYNYLTGKYAAYTISQAPSILKQGVKYKSNDGVHFKDSSNRDLTTHYPYFQFQSVRTKTSYSAAELDYYIMETLKERQKLGGNYANAAKRSKLIGLGSYLKEVEAKHRVNAMFILAAAIHESNFGMSGNAQTKNNLFGIRVFDSMPGKGSMYATPARSVDAFIREYMNLKYAVPGGMYAKGAVPGNKTIGFNAHYASDPTWGSKIASHMTKIDQKLGGKDYGRHTIALTKPAGTMNVYNGPSTGSGVLYQYKARDKGRSGDAGYPVVVVEQKVGADGQSWSRIYADVMKKGANGQNVEYGWVPSAQLTVVSQGK